MDIVCKKCDVIVGYGGAGVIKVPEDKSFEWLSNHCWICGRSREEVEHDPYGKDKKVSEVNAKYEEISYGHAVNEDLTMDQATERRLDPDGIWRMYHQPTQQYWIDENQSPSEEKKNAQVAPYPAELKELVDACTYRPGWSVHLTDIDRGQGSEGLTLDIITLGYNTHHIDQGQTYRVHHYFPVPPAAYDRRSWQRWLFDRFHDVEVHECAEFFQINGERPYAPSHGPGNDPYMIREIGTKEDQHTTFRGELQL